MSADNITTCPSCGECALREWYEIGIETASLTRYQRDLVIGNLKVTYRCDCWECEYEFEHKFEPVPLQKPFGSTNCTTCYDKGCGEAGSCDGDCVCLSTQNSATVMMKNGATPRSWPSPFCAGFL